MAMNNFFSLQHSQRAVLIQSIFSDIIKTQSYALHSKEFSIYGPNLSVGLFKKASLQADSGKCRPRLQIGLFL